MKNRVSQKPLTGTLWGRIRVYSKILSPAVLALLALAAVAINVSAQDLYWDNGASTGNWNTNDANWTGSPWDNTTPANAWFTTVGGNITLA